MNKKKLLAMLLSLTMLGSIIGIPAYADNTDADAGTEQYEATDTVPAEELTEEPAEELTEESMEEPAEENMDTKIELFSDETVIYPIEKDQTYSFTNIGVISYDITGLSDYIDYVIYYKDGSISDYNWSKKPSTLSVPSGGKAVITPTSGTINAVIADEYFIVEEQQNPVMAKVTIKVGETYTYTNTSNVAYNLLSNAGGYNHYDYVLYDTDGNVSSYAYNAYSNSVEIPAGYSIKVTAVETTTTFNGIYEKFNVTKNAEPTMKKTVISVGETYTYTNTSNVAYNLLSNAGGYNHYDYVLYYSNGAVKETKSSSSSSSVTIPAEGKIKITVIDNDTTFNGLYEIFDVTANTTLENYQTLSSDSTYIITNTDTVDNTLQFTTTSTSDYAIYSADGALSEYKTRSSGDITIPKGGKAIITPNSLAMYSFVNTETVAVSERANPVYNTTYLNPGETYKYTNTASRELKVFKNGLSCDYVIYNADGSINSYAANATDESFTVPIGGSICITSRVYLNIKGLYDYFTVEKTDNSVFDIAFSSLGETYQFTNNAVKDINLILSGSIYDYAIYKADGSVSSETMNASSSTITVPSGNKCVITPLVSNISIYALRDAFTFSKRSYPVMKRVPVSYGESVAITNTSNEDRTLYNKTGSYIDYVTYDAGENPQEAKELVTSSVITVPAGGKAVVTAKLSSTCVGGLYEAFSDEDFSVKVTGVTISSNYLSLATGKQSVLTATVLPSDATNKSITWSSSDTDIVTIAQTGKVTAKAVGTAVVTATTADGGYSASCTVNVTDGTSTGTAVTGITLNKTSTSLAIGETEKLTATVTPENATNATVMWTSSNSNIASVINGAVTAKSAGTTTITATTADGGFTAECVITVTGNAVPKDYPYEIRSLSLETESGTVLSSAPVGRSFIVNAELIEKQERAEKDYLFIAVYGTDGALLSMNYMKSDFVTNQIYNLGLNIQAQSKPIGTIKAFVWSGFDGMELLAEIKEL